MNIFPVACFGEILWDRLPTGDQPGGAPMNVAYHLNQLGIPAALISRVGRDEWGRRLLRLLQDRNVSTRFIQTDEDYTTGLVQATVHSNHEVSYEIQQPVAWDFIQSDDAIAGLMRQARFFVFGSLTARNETSRKTLFTLLEHPVTRVFDINLRAPHYNQQGIEPLLLKTDILKLNENELPLLSSWYGTYQNRKEQVQFLQDRFNINTIVVTCGGEGALLLLDGKLYTHKGYKVTVNDTVGSGDAFLAAFLFKTITGAAPEEGLQFANRLGAFVATQAGACPVYTIEQTSSIQ